MRDILKLARVQIICIVLFFFGKAMIRPYVLKNDFPNYADIVVLSLPNFFEGVIGMMTVTMLGLYSSHALKISIRNKWIYFLALILASIYVITQELKIHNIGGNNVYDPNDVVFSIIGLLTGYGIILLIHPTIKD